MQVFRCIVYQDGAMNLALLVAHALADDSHQARQLVRRAVEEFGVNMHVGALTPVANVPIEYFSEKPVKLSRFNAGF